MFIYLCAQLLLYCNVYIYHLDLHTHTRFPLNIWQYAVCVCVCLYAHIYLYVCVYKSSYIKQKQLKRTKFVNYVVCFMFFTRARCCCFFALIFILKENFSLSQCDLLRFTFSLVPGEIKFSVLNCILNQLYICIYICMCVCVSAQTEKKAFYIHYLITLFSCLHAWLLLLLFFNSHLHSCRKKN